MRGLPSALTLLLSCSDVVATHTFDVLATNGTDVFYMDEPVHNGDGRLLRVNSQTSSVLLASGTGEPMQLVADGSGVYWTAFGQVLKATSLDGTMTLTLATFAASLPISAAETEVFWFSSGSPVTLQATTKDGSATRTVSQGVDLFVTALSITPQLAFWSEWGTQDSSIGFGTIQAVNVDGTGAVTTVAQVSGSADGMATDEQFVYWVALTATGTRVSKAPQSGGAESVIATVASTLDSCDTTMSCGAHDRLRIDGDDLFWSDSHTLHRIPKSGGNPIAVVNSDDRIKRFVVSGKSVYYLTSGGLHRVVR